MDVWLWAARFFKTRTLAKQAVEAGRVSVNEAVAGKPAKPIRVGDRLLVRRGEERFEILVEGLSEQRGPAPAARALYTETEASALARAAERQRGEAERAGFQAPRSRPDKRARRLIRALGDIEAL